jgi:hypothetical protein
MTMLLERINSLGKPISCLDNGCYSKKIGLVDMDLQTRELLVQSGGQAVGDRAGSNFMRGGVSCKDRNLLSLIFPAIPANHIPDPIELVSFIRGGASTGSIGRVAEFIQVPKKQLYRLLRIPPASRRATLGVNETDQLVQIARV